MKKRLEHGRLLFAQECKFLRPVKTFADLPPTKLPEIAFAGRSNVGKSSLINALVRQHGLARTSNTPGRTQELNYFAAEIAGVYIVDLPGYGYAKRAKVERARAVSVLVRRGEWVNYMVIRPSR